MARRPEKSTDGETFDKESIKHLVVKEGTEATTNVDGVCQRVCAFAQKICVRVSVLTTCPGDLQW